MRLALRSLLRTPGYTVVALLTLALGIGATTAIFSIVDAVLLRPLDYARPGELVAVRCVIPSVARDYPTLPVNARFYTEWAASPAFSSLALIDRGRTTLTGAGEPVRLAAVYSSANLFSTLGLPPALGRAFTDGETAAVVISDHLWRTRFSADPGILGRAITLNLKPCTVVGVLPAGFTLPGLGSVSAPEVYFPRTFDAQELAEVIGRFNYEVVGRLAPGLTPAAGAIQLDTIAARLSQLAPDQVEVRSFVQPLQSAVVGDARRGLWILLGAIGAVLALACLNLGLLGLTRAERRSHDSAVRAALGASRGHLLAASFAESLLLSAAGGALGCLLAWWLRDTLVALAPADLPRLNEVRLNAPVLLFALGSTLLTTLLAGVVPAWFAARRDAAGEVLASGGSRVSGGRSARRLRATFIGLELAVSTLLLTLAALLVGSFARVLRADVGFDAPSVLTSSLNIPRAQYREPADVVGYYRRVLAALEATPGVTSAAVANLLPLKGQTWVDSVHLAGDNRPSFQRPSTNVRFVSPGYFATLGLPLLGGRTFRPGEPEGNVIISAQLARSLWPGQDALGRQLLRGDGDHVTTFTVIGVAGDARTDVDQRPVSVLYRTLDAWPMSELALALRLDPAQPASADSLRRAIRSVDAAVPIQPFRTMGEIFDAAVSRRRFQMQLVAAFACAALSLAALGLYGVVAHSVTQRTRELGIRLAFGAPPAALSGLMLRQNLRPVAFGLLAGLAGALAGGRLLAGFLYETDPRDPAILAAVVGLLALVALVASWLPARRATRVDPMIALRAE